MGLDESLKLLVIAHEEGRHELARTPSVNVCSGHRRSGAEVFGDLLEVEMLGYVLLPVFVFPLGVRFTGSVTVNGPCDRLKKQNSERAFERDPTAGDGGR